MTDTILAEFQTGIEGVELVPSSGGAFEVGVDGEVVFSKKELGRFPEDDEVIGPLRSRA